MELVSVAHSANRLRPASQRLAYLSLLLCLSLKVISQETDLSFVYLNFAFILTPTPVCVCV